MTVLSTRANRYTQVPRPRGTTVVPHIRVVLLTSVNFAHRVPMPKKTRLQRDGRPTDWPGLRCENCGILLALVHDGKRSSTALHTVHTRPTRVVDERASCTHYESISHLSVYTHSQYLDSRVLCVMHCVMHCVNTLLQGGGNLDQNIPCPEVKVLRYPGFL